MPVLLERPHALRAGQFLSFLRQDHVRQHMQANPATWFARHRVDPERLPVGCPFGHYVARARPGPISLVPIKWKAQLKMPGLQAELLAEYPLRHWAHYTLHYRTDRMEAFGLAAAGVFLRLRPSLVASMLIPTGLSYERRVPIESLVRTLSHIVGEDPCSQSSLPYSDPC